MKLNKEEISLCKQMAEKHRKDIEFGDFYYDCNFNKIALNGVWTSGKMHARSQKEIGVFPLWTISDCLEFLRERVGVWYELKGITHGPPYNEPMEDFIFRAYKIETFGKTPLEACLKAVLAVIEKDE